MNEVVTNSLKLTKKIGVTEWLGLASVIIGVVYGIYTMQFMWATLVGLVGLLAVSYKCENIAAYEVFNLVSEVFTLSTDSQMELIERLMDEESPPSAEAKERIRKMLDAWKKGRKLSVETERQSTDAV